jgi:hypothetical protein
VRRCDPLDRVKLVSAPRSCDLKAIGVADRKGRLMGYLDRRCAMETMNAARLGTRFEVLVAARWDDPSGACGLVVAILHLKPQYHDLKQAEIAIAAAALNGVDGSRKQQPGHTWGLTQVTGWFGARTQNLNG